MKIKKNKALFIDAWYGSENLFSKEISDLGFTKIDQVLLYLKSIIPIEYRFKEGIITYHINQLGEGLNTSGNLYS